MYWKKEQQIQEQIQMSAYEKKVAYEKFQSTLKWLEKYVEIVHSDQFENWENRKQFREDGIKRKDIINDPKRVERLLSISFLSFEGFTDHPDLLEKMKEEFHQWISATGIDVDNCPEKLKNYLIGLSDILEGQGEKVNEDAKNRKPMFDENSPEYAEGLNEFFSALQNPMQHAREEEQSLKDKKYNDLKVGGRFSEFNAEQGENALKRMKLSVSNHDSQNNFHYFPQKDQDQVNLIDSDEEMTDYNSKQVNNSNDDRKKRLGYNCRALIESVKKHKRDWRIDRIITNSDSNEWEIALIRKDVRLEYNHWTKELNLKGKHVYRKQDFTNDEWKEIKQVLNSSDYLDIVENIKKNISEWDFKPIVTYINIYFESKWVRKIFGKKEERMLVHKSLRNEDLRYNKKGYLYIDEPLKKMFRKEDFDQRDWVEIERIWINHNYDLSLKKQRGEIPLEGWESWEGLQKWIIELETKIKKDQQIQRPHLVDGGATLNGEFYEEVSPESVKATQEQINNANQIQQKLREKNSSEQVWIMVGISNETLALITSGFIKLFNHSIT